MASKTPRLERIHSETNAIAQQNASMREVNAKCMEVLKTPVPDTFLGRKTYEPFPAADETAFGQPSSALSGIDTESKPG